MPIQTTYRFDHSRWLICISQAVQLSSSTSSLWAIKKIYFLEESGKEGLGRLRFTGKKKVQYRAEVMPLQKSSGGGVLNWCPSIHYRENLDFTPAGIRVTEQNRSSVVRLCLNRLPNIVDYVRQTNEIELTNNIVNQTNSNMEVFVGFWSVTFNFQMKSNYIIIISINLLAFYH